MGGLRLQDVQGSPRVSRGVSRVRGCRPPKPQEALKTLNLGFLGFRMFGVPQEAPYTLNPRSPKRPKMLRNKINPHFPQIGRASRGYAGEGDV